MQSTSNPAAALRRLINGYQISQTIHVAETLGVADLLAGGGRTTDELAMATKTHSPTLYRLLGALASTKDQLFELTPLGNSFAPTSPAPWRAGPLSLVGPAIAVPNIGDRRRLEVMTLAQAQAPSRASGNPNFRVNKLEVPLDAADGSGTRTFW